MNWSIGSAGCASRHGGMNGFIRSASCTSCDGGMNLVIRSASCTSRDGGTTSGYCNGTQLQCGCSTTAITVKKNRFFKYMDFVQMKKCI